MPCTPIFYLYLSIYLSISIYLSRHSKILQVVRVISPPHPQNRRWPPHRKNPENPLTKMAEELGDEDLVDYEEDEVVDDKPADEVKK